MHVLLLSPKPDRIAAILEDAGDSVTVTAAPLRSLPDADFIVSYGYRHILREPVIGAFAGRAINLHISLLPWGRGADPNFWSWFDDTPKGVSVHYIDAGIDTGDVIVQAKMPWVRQHAGTLRTTYDELQDKIVALFGDCWSSLRDGKISSSRQVGRGSYHSTADIERWIPLLSQGWNSPVAEVQSLSAEQKMSAAFWSRVDHDIRQQ